MSDKHPQFVWKQIKYLEKVSASKAAVSHYHGATGV